MGAPIQCVHGFVADSGAAGAAGRPHGDRGPRGVTAGEVLVVRSDDLMFGGAPAPAPCFLAERRLYAS